MADNTVRLTITVDDRGVTEGFAKVRVESKETEEALKRDSDASRDHLSGIGDGADDSSEGVGRLRGQVDDLNDSLVRVRRQGGGGGGTFGLGSLLGFAKVSGYAGLGGLGLAGAGLGFAGAGIGALGAGTYESVKSVAKGHNQAATALSSITSSLKGVEHSFGQTMTPIVAQFARVFHGIVPELEKVLRPLGPILSASVGPLTKSLGGFLVQFSRMFVAITPTLTNALTESMPMITTLFQSTFSLLSSTLKTLLPPVDAALKATLPPLATAISEAMPAVGEAIKQWLPPLANMLRMVVPPLAAALQVLMPPVTAALRIVSDAIRVLAPPITRMFKALVGPITRLVTDLEPVIIRMINRLAPPMERLISTLAPVMTRLITKLTPAITRLVTALAPVIVQLTKAWVRLAVPLTNALIKLMPAITLFADGVSKLVGAGSAASDPISGKGPVGILRSLTIGSKHEALSPEWFANKIFHSAGGLITSHFAGGGLAGPRGTDTIPAWLSAGEYVMRKQASDRIGLPALNTMNATGMLPGASSPSMGGAPINAYITITNQMEGRKVGEQTYKASLRQNALTGAYAAVAGST